LLAASAAAKAEKAYISSASLTIAFSPLSAVIS